MNLVIREGQEAGRQFRLDRGVLTIGRGQDCNLVLLDTQASRHHAELRRFGDQWLIVDLGSTNGTYVGGVRLQPDEPRALPPGVLASIGDTAFALEEDRGNEPVVLPPEYADAISEGPVVTPRAGPAWAILAWVTRLIAAAGAALLLAGSLLDWVRVEVTVPILGRVVDRLVSGMDSDQAYLFMGVAVVALVLVVLDVASARWGLAAGLTQALLGAGAGASSALSAYRYYQLGQQQILGISLLDLAAYARTSIKITAEPGLKLVIVGLVSVIVGGLIRVVVAALRPEG